jgi:hypothetical protein
VRERSRSERRGTSAALALKNELRPLFLCQLPAEVFKGDIGKALASLAAFLKVVPGGKIDEGIKVIELKMLLTEYFKKSGYFDAPPTFDPPK